MKHPAVRLSIALLQVAVLCLVPTAARSQMLSASGQNAVPRPGDGHDYIHLLNETVNPGSGSVNVKIDIPQPPGKGLTLPFSISYNSGGVWTVVSDGDGDTEIQPTNDSGTPDGWSYSYPKLTYKNVRIHYEATPSGNAYLAGSVPDADPNSGTTCTWTTDYVFYDPSGQPHPLGIGALDIEPGEIAECPGPTGYTIPGTALSAVPDGGDNSTKAHLHIEWPVNGVYDDHPTQVTTMDGTTYNFPGAGILAQPRFQVAYPSTVTDRNGNTVTYSTLPHPVDSAGRVTPILTVPGNDSGVPHNVFDNIALSVSGTSNPYQIQWVPLLASGPSIYGTLLSTGYPGCSENPTQFIGAFNSYRTPMGIGTITLPNGGVYTFGYDSVTGLLKTITYPNHAVVTYQWQLQHNFDQSVISHVIPGNQWVVGDYYRYVANQLIIPADPSWNANDVSFPCSYAYDWPAIVSRTVKFDGVNIALSQTFEYTTTLGTAMDRTTTVTTTDHIQNTTTKRVYHYYLRGENDNDPYPFDAPQYGVTALGGMDTLVGPLPRPPVWTLPLEDTVTDYDNANNVLKTVTKSWASPIVGQWGGEPLQAYADAEQLQSEITTLGSNTASTFYVYENPDNNLARLKRKVDIGYDNTQLITDYSYQDIPGPTQPYQYHFGQSIFDQPCRITKSTAIVTIPACPSPIPSSSSLVAETDYTGYDTNGNVGTITQKCWQASGACTDESVGFTYDTSGLVNSRTDALGTTTYERSSAYANAYVTKITYPSTNGVAHVENFTYDFPSGSLTGAEDENTNWTYYFYNDPLGRLTETDYPDHGKTTIQYNDSGSSPTITVVKADGGTSVSTMDGMAHVIQTQQVTTDGSTPTVYVDTVYDGNGRVASVTNPYFLGDSKGTTSFFYDELGRKKYQCQPDNGGAAVPCQPGNSYLAWQYGSDATLHGDVTTFTDEVRNSTARTTDAFGRLIQVSEPGGLLTMYSYDPLSNLTYVNQLGNGTTEAPRTRSFTYDSLSRLLTSANPETGTICYGIWAGGICVNGYDGNGNLLYKTDARGIVTSYGYDALNRVQSKTYNDGTASSCYSYDSVSLNGVGRLAMDWTQSAQSGPCSSPSQNAKSSHTILAYDSMGRLLQDKRCARLSGCTSQTYRPMTYSYDLAGHPTSSSDGIGIRSFIYQYDSAGRMTDLSTGGSGGSASLFSIPSYGPVGWTGATIGPMSMERTYDNRTRLTGETVIVP